MALLDFLVSNTALVCVVVAAASASVHVHLKDTKQDLVDLVQAERHHISVEVGGQQRDIASRLVASETAIAEMAAALVRIEAMMKNQPACNTSELTDRVHLLHTVAVNIRTDVAALNRAAGVALNQLEAQRVAS